MLQNNTPSETLAYLSGRYREAHEAWAALMATCDISDETGDAISDGVSKIAEQMAGTPVTSAADALAVLDWHYFEFGEGSDFSWRPDADYGAHAVHGHAMLASLREWLASQEASS